MIINNHYVSSLLQSRITVSEKELLIVLIRLRVLASQSALQFIHKYRHITCAQLLACWIQLKAAICHHETRSHGHFVYWLIQLIQFSQSKKLYCNIWKGLTLTKDTQQSEFGKKLKRSILPVFWIVWVILTGFCRLECENGSYVIATCVTLSQSIQ